MSHALIEHDFLFFALFAGIPSNHGPVRKLI